MFRIAPELRFSSHGRLNRIAAPTLVDGGVLLVGRDRSIRRLDDDGAERWATPLARGSSASATVCGDQVFVGDESGAVWALALSTGEVRWVRDVGAMVAGTGLVVGETLVLGAGAARLGARGGGIVGLSVHDGAIDWQIELAPGCRTRPVPLADGVVLGAHDGVVRALGPDGTVRWATPVGPPVLGAAAVCGDVVAVPLTDGSVVGLADDDGTERWRLQTAFALHRAELATDGRRVFLGGSDGRLRALHPDGSEAWGVHPDPDGEPTVWGSPTVVDGALIAAGEVRSRTVLHGLSSDDGTPLWTLPLDGRTPSRVVQRDRRLALCCAHDPPSLHVLSAVV